MELLADSLIANLDRLHTTPQGAARIRRNLSLGEQEPVAWCPRACARSGGGS